MHPAMADCTLHLSLVPKNGSTKPLQVSIPVSLGALAVPGRRNGLLRAPWAAAASGTGPGAADFGGDMALSATPHDRDAAPLSLQFLSLISRALSAGRPHLESQSTASQVHHHQYALH